MMDLDLLGSFWPVGQPDNRLPGRLVLDVRKGPVLTLCGWFDDPGRVAEQAHTGLTGTVSIGLSEMLGSGSPPIRILGDTTGGPVSLDHCLVGRASWSFGSSGLPTAEYRALKVFQGVHFDDHTPLRFDAITLRLGHFAQWIGKSGLRIDPTQDPKAVDQIRITVPPPERRVASTELGVCAVGDSPDDSWPSAHNLTHRVGATSPVSGRGRFSAAGETIGRIGSDAPRGSPAATIRTAARPLPASYLAFHIPIRG